MPAHLSSFFVIALGATLAAWLRWGLALLLPVGGALLLTALGMDNVVHLAR